MSLAMPYADFVFGNESEAATYGETKVRDCVGRWVGVKTHDWTVETQSVSERPTTRRQAKHSQGLHRISSSSSSSSALFCSVSPPVSFFDHGPWEQGYGSDLPTIALKLAAEPKRSGTRARVVVFTQGADATIVACNGVVTTYPVEKLAPELLVDTNGTNEHARTTGRRRR
jgi:hypothetical protein